MPLPPMEQNNTAQDNHQYSRQDNQAGEYEELKLRDLVPRGGAKRLVDVDKHQRLQGRPQNQPHDILFTVYVTWYFLIPHSHLFASILEQM